MKSVLRGIFEKNHVLKHVTIDGVRLHLKTDERKLWVNGYHTLFLNPTASFIVESFIDSCYEVPKESIFDTTVNKVSAYYGIDRNKATEGFQNVLSVINRLATNEFPCDMVGIMDTKEDKAPNRMDLSLTYRCQNKCPHCYLPQNRSDTELTTSQWKEVLDRLWKIGIPQVVFTGGECTLRGDLPDLVMHAQQFTTGIITNGAQVSGKLAKDLRNAELDWIQITLDSSHEDVHDTMQGRKGAFSETVSGIKSSVDAGLLTSVNCTLTKANYTGLIELLDLAKSLGVSVVTTNALIRSGRGATVKDESGLTEEELKEPLSKAVTHAQDIGISFNWFLPTCYKVLNPMDMGFGQRCCSACSVNMMIEPDGSVIPCQSWTQMKLGNILTTPWVDIWNGKESRKIREYNYASSECKACEYFHYCGGGCPLEKINGGKKCYGGM